MIIIRNSLTGAERLVEDGVPYRLGRDEAVHGSTTLGEDFEVDRVVSQYAKDSQRGVGDAIKFIADKTGLAKALGKENCSACERRRIVYNNLYRIYKDRGFQGTLDILKEIH
jgi:hypothetical protein